MRKFWRFETADYDWPQVAYDDHLVDHDMLDYLDPLEPEPEPAPTEKEMEESFQEYSRRMDEEFPEICFGKPARKDVS